MKSNSLAIAMLFIAAMISTGFGERVFEFCKNAIIRLDLRTAKSRRLRREARLRLARERQIETEQALGPGFHWEGSFLYHPDGTLVGVDINLGRDMRLPVVIAGIHISVLPTPYGENMDTKARHAIEAPWAMVLG